MARKCRRKNRFKLCALKEVYKLNDDVDLLLSIVRLAFSIKSCGLSIMCERITSLVLDTCVDKIGGSSELIMETNMLEVLSIAGADRVRFRDTPTLDGEFRRKKE